MGSQPHQQQVEHGNAEAANLHLSEGCGEEGAADARESSRDGDTWPCVARHSDERSTQQLLEPCMPETTASRRRVVRRSVEQQKEILDNWKNMVKNLCQNYLLKENQMTMHINAMHPKTLARFLMNMITY